MQTNFFSLINQLDISGIVKLVIAKSDNGQLVVSILMDNVKCSPKDRKCLPPLNLTASALDLDEGFFETISQPMNQTATLLRSKEQYMKSLEAAKAKGNSPAKDKVAPVLNPKEKKYNELMALSRKLETERKFKEAWTKLPDPIEFPDQAELIRNKRQELSEKFAPDLFAPLDNAPKTFPVKDTNPVEEEPQEEEGIDDLEYNEYSGLETEDNSEFES